MPSCVALGCQKRADAVLKIFPRKDHRRRQIWAERVNRPGWTPTKYSALCERHFDKDQWELPREDGKCKLKATALPTIFVVHNPYDVATKDHSYCVPFYRKIYRDTNFEKGFQDNDKGIMPIEHIKIEEDENEDFTPEIMEVEEEGETKGEEEVSIEDIENIQCTPDISVYPEHGEPFPIEMVDCENDEVNAFLAEPDDDPLAISAEDQVQASTTKPFFGNSQKFLFIPKQTKFVQNVIPKAKGDLKVKSLESTGESIGNPVAKPTLKVKSLDGLLDPNMVLKSPPTNCERLDPKTVLESPSAPTNCERSDPKTVLTSPSAMYVKERSTITDTPSSSFVSKVKSFHSRPKLEFDKKIVRLTSPYLEIPPKLKIISTHDSSQPKINLVYGINKFSVKKDLDFIRKTVNLKIEKPVVLPFGPNIFTDNTKNIPMGGFISPEVKSITERFLNGDAENVSDDKALKITSKPDENDKEKSRVERKSTDATKDPIQLNPVSLDHYGCNSVSEPSTMYNVVKEGDSFDKQIGNNDVKLWLKSKILLKKNQPDKLFVQENESSKISTAEKSSIIVLDPFQSSKKPQRTDICDSPRNISRSDFLKNRFLPIFKCNQCQISFISQASLWAHKIEKHVKNKDSEDNDVIIVETSSESSIDFLDSELPLDDDSSSVQILSEESDLEEDFEENTDSLDSSSSSDESKFTNTANEENREEEDDYDEEEVVVVKESITEKKNSLNKLPCPFKNNFVTIPDLNALSNIKKNEILKISSDVNVKSSKVNGSFNGKTNYKPLSFRSDQKFEPKRVENISKIEENFSNSHIKLNREISTNFEDEASRIPIVLIPKLDLSKFYPKENGSFKINFNEKKPLVKSDDDVNEISFKNEGELSENQKSLSAVLSKSHVKQVKCELIKNRKNRLRSELSKLDSKDKHVGNSLQPNKVNIDSNKPIVLLPKLNGINSVKEDGSGGITKCRGSLSEVVTISDDEEFGSKEPIILDAKNKTDFSISKAQIKNNKVQEKMPVMKTDLVTSCANKSEISKENQVKNKKPSFLLKELRFDGHKKKHIVERRDKRITRNSSKELSSYKSKIKENSPSKRGSLSAKALLYKNNIKNVVVRKKIK